MDTYQDYSTKLVEEKELVRITGEQFDQMVAAGIWGDHSPIELWDGFLRLKNCRDWEDESIGHGDRHAAAIRRFARALFRQGVESVQVQLPIAIDQFSRPEPDLSILVPPLEQYDNRPPTAADVLVAVECGSSSLHFDLYERAPVLAAANIPTYIVVDLVHNIIEMFSNPNATQSCYETRQTLRDGDQLVLVLESYGTVQIPITDLLPATEK